MKAFFCVNYPKYNMSEGISKKIESQISVFEKFGYTVYYSAYVENGVAIFNGEKEILTWTKPSFIIDRIYKVFRFQVLLLVSCRFISKQKFDVGFIRWNAINSLYIRFIKALKKTSKYVIMDFHGYFPNAKYKKISEKYLSITTKLNGAKISDYVDLALTESKLKSIFGIKCMNIDTCIDVSKYDIHIYHGKENELNLISVANEKDYHGYDRLIKGIYFYNKSEKDKVHFHLVGKISKKTIKLIKKLELENYVHVYGYLDGDEKKEVYSKCNVGVGPLAQSRVGGKQGTGIKTKEYFAIGLPYIVAGEELIVPNNYPYVLELNDDESLIDIECVKNFYMSFRNNPNYKEEMREFARKNFSWQIVFKNALNEVSNIK